MVRRAGADARGEQGLYPRRKRGVARHHNGAGNGDCSPSSATYRRTAWRQNGRHRDRAVAAASRSRTAGFTVKATIGRRARTTTATREFVRSGRVADAARGSAPASAREAASLERAEQAGKRRARGEDPQVAAPRGTARETRSPGRRPPHAREVGRKHAARPPSHMVAGSGRHVIRSPGGNGYRSRMVRAPGTSPETPGTAIAVLPVLPPARSRRQRRRRVDLRDPRRAPCGWLPKPVEKEPSHGEPAESQPAAPGRPGGPAAPQARAGRPADGASDRPEPSGRRRHAATTRTARPVPSRIHIATPATSRMSSRT